MVFGRGGTRWRRREGKHGRDAEAPHRTRCTAPHDDASAYDGGFTARRRRALGHAARLAARVGADGLLFVVLPDQAAMHTGLERHGDVEADGHQRGEQQSAERHPVIVPGARRGYSVASR